MGVHGGPDIVEDGLVFAIDAGNGQSYVSGSLDTFSLVSSETGSLKNDTGFSNDNQGSWVLDGADDYIDCGDVAEVDGASALTLSGWIKPANTTDTQVLVSKFTDSNNRTNIGIANDLIWFNVSNGGGKYANVSFTDTGWNHLVMVFDGSGTGNTGRLKGYVNGVDQTLSYSGTIATTLADNGSNPFTIGRQDSDYMEGNIANVKVYNKALTAAEVLQNYNATKERFI